MNKARVELPVPANHPAYEGHFPGMPVLPGVVLLDEALHAAGNTFGHVPGGWRIGSVKFLVPVRPAQPLEVCLERTDSGSIRFDILSGDQKVATGTVTAGATVR
jgi:3-hydroxymyristoyl/3-hydroxydecanoyl-(acyl carrier protein) dehydratase